MVKELTPNRVVDLASHRSTQARSVREALGVILEQDKQPDRVAVSPIATGFDLLDRVLDGGLRSHDLMLLGGGPGVGKTVAALQIARHIAMQGRTAVYISYEHDDATMLGRLLAVELAELARSWNAPEVDRLRTVVVEATAGFRRLDEVIRDEPLVKDAYERIGAYADRLLLVRGSGAHTDLQAIQKLLAGTDVVHGGAVVVDYLQKVAMHPDPDNEAEKVTRVTEGLKDMALNHDMAVIALVAADWDGLRSGRVRLHHLRGSSALAYECDVAVMLNDKHLAVSRTHLAYDSARAESFRQQVVFSVEKNRGGPAMVDLEYRKDFLHYRFETQGSYMAERSSDDRLEPA